MIALDSISARTTHLIRTKGIKINALAAKIGLSGQGLRDILSGKSKSPKADVVVSLAQELGVSTDWLLKGSDGGSFSGFELQDTITPYGLPRTSARPSQTYTFVPYRAIQGFVAHYDNLALVEDLQRFALPEAFSLKGEVVAFEVDSDGAAPGLNAGSMAICTAETGDMRYIQSGLLYAIIYAGHFGIRRVVNRVQEQGIIELYAADVNFPPIKVRVEDIQKLWRVQLVMQRV